MIQGNWEFREYYDLFYGKLVWNDINNHDSQMSTFTIVQFHTMNHNGFYDRSLYLI
jgi:hypothetical protein